MSRWSKMSADAIARVVRDNPGLREAGPKVLLAAIDAAYPFGERAMHPYKVWLKERSKAMRMLGLMPGAKTPVPPTPDEAAVCMVARDLVEMGRDAEAKALLAKQAPNRLGRGCPACGARMWGPCFEAVSMEPREGATSPYYGIHRSVEMLVPHEARVTDGPLFARTQ